MAKKNEELISVSFTAILIGCLLMPLLIFIIGLERAVTIIVIPLWLYAVIKRLIKQEKNKKNEKLKDLEKKTRKNIIEKYNARYPTIEEKLEHINDLINLIYHKTDISLSPEEAWFIIEYNETEENIKTIDYSMKKLKTKSEKNIAQMLIKIGKIHPTSWDEYIEEVLNLYEIYLERHWSVSNKNTVMEEIDTILDQQSAQHFEEKLKRSVEEKITVAQIEKMDGFAFEELLWKLYKKAWYHIRVTQRSWDQWADLIIEKDGIATVIQAKRYTGKVNNSAIQEVVASKKFYDCDEAIVVTTAQFTKSAISLAKINGVQLIDGKELDKLFDTFL